MRTVRALPVVTLAFFLVSSLVIASPSETQPAQQATAAGTATAADPASVGVTFPLIVTELHGTVQVQGTANMPGMRSYFLEWRSLNDDGTVPSDAIPWVPATLPVSAPVQAGVLADWDTTLIPDGLYELRLTVTRDNAPSVYYVVTPLRIANAQFSTLTPVAATQSADQTPRVTASVSSNVRSGDSVSYPVVGILSRWGRRPVLGVSSDGSGWFYIQLADGTKGWISPIVVVKTGNFSNVPTMTPPNVLFTLTPTPAQTSLLLNGIALNPASPTCGSTFNVTVNVNNPTNAVTAAGTVYLQDVDLGSGAVTTTGSGDVPALNPGANFVVTVPLTVVLYYNEIHEVRANIASSQITSRYTLAQGSCNVPTTTPQSVTAIPPTATSGNTPIPSPTSAAPSATPHASATTAPTTAVTPTTATMPATSAATGTAAK